MLNRDRAVTWLLRWVWSDGWARPRTGSVPREKPMIKDHRTPEQRARANVKPWEREHGKLEESIGVSARLHADGTILVTWTRLNIPNSHVSVHELSSCEVQAGAEPIAACLTACWNGAIEALHDRMQSPPRSV